MFITLEGIDRSGKSTQAALLADALGPQTLLLREPGGTEAGERIRDLLKDPLVHLGAGAELLLFLAARSELASAVIGPARREGRDIVCDRYIDSSVAYQGGMPGIGSKEIERANAMIVGECVPDLTVLVKVDPAVAAIRGQSRLQAGIDDGEDRFEGRGLGFQQAVAAAYDELAARHPQRIVAVDGHGDPAEVHERVMAAVATRR
ncbi:MAG: dTMP kinase [Actinomycetota bacterium]|nr:dTMP kinase [Actinomycetota bacterium]